MLVIGAVACLVLTTVLCQVPEEASEPNSQLCDSCKQLVSNLDNLLLKHTSKAELDILLKQICSALPDDLHLDCEETVLLNTSLIGQTFLHGLLLDQVCANLGLCPAPEPVEAIPPPKTDEIECSLCKLVIDQVKSKLNDHATQDEIKAAFEQVCALLPSFAHDECTQFIEKYQEQIIQMLLSVFTSEQICSSLGLCSSEVKVIGMVKTQLSKNATIAEVKQILGKVCNFAPIILKSKCRNLVNKYTEQLIQVLLSELAPKEICTRLRLCKADVEEMIDFEDASPPPSTDSLKCKNCQKLISAIKSRLGPNPTPDDVRNFLATACNSVSPIYRKKCKKFISQHEAQLIQLLSSNLSPTEICQRLGFCRAEVVDMTDFEDASPPPSIDGIWCNKCQQVISGVKSQLGPNPTPDDVKNYLATACNSVSFILKSRCRKFISQHEPQLIQLLSSNLSPTEICQRLEFCGAEVVDMTVNDILQISTDDIQCSMCKLVVGQLKSMLKSPAIQQKIKAALEKACDLLPSRFRNQCIQLIDNYEAQIIQILLSFTSDQICTTLGLCAADLKDFEDASPPPSTDSIKCKNCQKLISAIKSRLGPNPTPDDVRNFLATACKSVSPIYRKKCKKFISQHEVELIQLLSSNLSATEICQRLGFCGAEVVDMTVNDILQISTDDIQCSMCKLVVGQLKSILKSPAIQQKIKAALEKACDLLPSRFRNQCIQLIDNYEAQIIQILLSFTSDQICTTLGLCAADLKDFEDASPPPGTDSLKCDKCQKLISGVKSKLGPNPTADDVKNFLATACNSVPFIFRSKCQQFISQHEAQLIQLLLANLSPREICQKLQFCGADVGDKTGKTESLMFVPENK